MRSADGDGWVGSLVYCDKDGREAEERFSAESKSALECKINLRRRIINTSCIMAQKPKLTLFAAAAEYFKKSRKAQLSEQEAQTAAFMNKYPDFIIWQTRIREINDELLIFTANTLLTDGCTIPQIRLFFKWIYLIVNMYSSESGFYVDATIFPGKYDRKLGLVIPVCFEVTERRRFFKEALRVYPDSDNQPYYRLGTSLMFMMHTGIQANEFLAVTGDNLSSGYLTVKGHVLINCKTGSISVENQKSRRIKLSTNALSEVESLPYKSTRYFPDGFTVAGAAKLWRSLNEAYTAVLKNIGFDKKYAKFGLSVLRNTFAAACLKNNCPISELSVVLGHPDEEYTRMVYAGIIKKLELPKNRM